MSRRRLERAPGPAVVGLDLSLTRPAACRIPGDWEVGDWSRVVVASWEPAVPRGDGIDFERARIERLVEIADRVRAFVEMGARSPGDREVVVEPRVDAVGIESYAYSSSSSSVTKLAELGGVVRVSLFSYGIVPVPVVAASARKLLLGKLPRADQKAWVQAALKRARAPFWEDDDQADAFCVANWLRAELGGVALVMS